MATQIDIETVKKILGSGSVTQEMIALELCRKSCRYFIENFVKIEDRDAPELAVLFKMWDKQAEALDIIEHNRLNILLKARQLGISWLSLAYATWRLISRSGYAIVSMSKREEDAKELNRRIQFILRYLPSWMIQEKKTAPPKWGGLVWEATTMSVTIFHPGKEPAVFNSMSSGPDSGRSFTANLVILDEWAFQAWAEEIWAAAYPTINRPTGGQVIGLSTAKRGTLFERIWNSAVAGDNGFTPIFLPWWTDPRRTKEWYEQTKKDLPTTYLAEYPATPQEAFTIGEGAFFPQWDEEVHVIKDPTWYPPTYCQIHGAYDAGFGSRACFKWYAVFPDGYAVAYREYYPHAVTDPMQAQEVQRMSVDPRGEPEYLVSVVADPSCWNKQSSTGESTAEIFSRYGIYMSRADNDLSNGWRRLHQWLMPYEGKDKNKVAGLRFTWNCPNTIRTYPTCVQKKTNPEDIGNPESHCQDVDRYFCMSRPMIYETASFIPGDGGGGRTRHNFNTYFPDDDDEDDNEAIGFYN